MPQSIQTRPRQDLTPKQRRFVSEYLKDLNGTQAAIRAGYAPKSAKVIASRMLTKANLWAAVQRGQARDLSNTQITRHMLLVQQAANAFADRAGCFDSKTGRLLHIDEWPLEARISLENFCLSACFRVTPYVVVRS